VVAGLEVGVFQGRYIDPPPFIVSYQPIHGPRLRLHSAIANSYTLNVSGSSQQSYSTRADADAAFERAMAAGIVKKLIPAEARIVS
jgi:hypothetical protein